MYTHTHNPPLHKQTLSFSDFPNVYALTQQALHYYLYLYYVFFSLFSLNAVLPFLYPPSFYCSHLFQVPFHQTRLTPTKTELSVEARC